MREPAPTREWIIAGQIGRVWVPKAVVNFAVWRNLLTRIAVRWHERTRPYRRMGIFGNCLLEVGKSVIVPAGLRMWTLEVNAESTTTS